MGGRHKDGHDVQMLGVGPDQTLQPRLAAGVDPAAEFLGFGAAVGAGRVEPSQHLLRAREVAAFDLEFAIVLGGAAVVGGDGEGLLIEGLGAGVVALVTLLSLPPLLRMMRPDGLRTE